MASKRLKTVRKRNGVSAPYKGNGRKRAARRVSAREPEVQAAGAFFAARSLEELARLQGVKPLENISALAGGFPADEDIDAFLDDIYEHRESA